MPDENKDLPRTTLTGDEVSTMLLDFAIHNESTIPNVRRGGSAEELEVAAQEKWYTMCHCFRCNTVRVWIATDLTMAKIKRMLGE